LPAPWQCCAKICRLSSKIRPRSYRRLRRLCGICDAGYRPTGAERADSSG
jgi:hypothetical protein